MIRVVVADDQALVRAGLVALVGAAPGMEVVGEAEDGAAAVALVADLCPDVVLMDIRMPRMDGIAATRAILSGDGPHPRVVVLTTFDLDEYVYGALAAGASAFLLKDTPAPRILGAVHAVLDGDTLLGPDVTRRLVERFAPAAAPSSRDVGRLTARETEVLVLVAGGAGNGDIADTLVLSEETVKTHVKRIMSKLGLASRAQAVVVAYEAGLVVPGGPRSSGRRTPRSAAP